MLISVGMLYLTPLQQGRVRYLTQVIERGAIITEVSVAGTVNALVRTEVSSQLSGQVTEVLMDFNDKVIQGQVLARLDPRSYQARVREATADLDMAMAEVTTRQAMLEQRAAELANAEAMQAVVEAEAQSSLAKSTEAKLELERRQALTSKTLIAEREIAEARAEYASRSALLQAARARIKVQEAAILAAQASARIAESELTHVQAEVRQRQAALDQVTVDLYRTEILSPMEGLVIRRDVDVGQTVAASLQAPTLFTIAKDLSEMTLECQVDEADIGRIRLGQQTHFTVDAYPGRRFDGSVIQIRKAPMVFQNVVTYSVIVSVENRDQALFPGMTAIAHIRVEEQQDILRVPNAALRYLPTGRPAPTLEPSIDEKDEPGLSATIWRLDQTGAPQPVTIRTGATDDRYSALLAGPLQEGDAVITAEVAGSL
jgi:HlyD family secretion protein